LKRIEDGIHERTGFAYYGFSGCKGTFGCHSFGLNSDPASAISCASAVGCFGSFPLLPQLDVASAGFHSSTNLASAPLLLFCSLPTR
jgi:hypothetical protein